MATDQKPAGTPTADKPDDNPRPVVKADRTLTEKIESGEFDETDADERGWITFRAPADGDGVRKETRVPVQHWPLYERTHKL